MHLDDSIEPGMVFVSRRDSSRPTGLLVLLISAFITAQAPAAPELIECRKIWDAAPHNAFTDLIRFQDEWFCVFREGAKHVSPDGALRVIVSRDGHAWKSAALLQDSDADLRDAKITVTPDRRLLLSGAAALPQPGPVKHRSLVWFSEDGREWSESHEVADPDVWLWRVTWHEGKAYGAGYATGDDRFLRLYASSDGRRFETIVPRLHDEGYPNETSILFRPNDTALCLLRRDGTPNTALLGRASPPYREWRWTDLGVRIGGPHMMALPDGRLVAAVRLYDGGARTSLVWVDAEAGRLTEFLKLPSGGDTSYAGLGWHEGMVWVSYYSSHEGKTSIYLAKVAL
jgi:hypothetical protein